MLERFDSPPPNEMGYQASAGAAEVAAILAWAGPQSNNQEAAREVTRKNDPPDKLPDKQQQNPVERSGFLSDSPSFDDQNYELMRRFGVKMVAAGDQILYRYVDTNSSELMRSANDERGLQSTMAALDRLTKATASELEKRYGVLFSNSDDTFSQKVPGSHCQSKATVETSAVHCREPRLVELEGIKAALKDSEPSNLGPDNAPVKFYFLTSNLVPNSIGAGHYVETDGHGHGAVVFDAETLVGCAPTRRSNPSGDSIEDLVVHELAHGTQHNLKMGGNGERATYAQSIGWVPYLDKATQTQGWLLQGSHNELYSTGNGCTTQSWSYVNSKGQTLDGPNGKVVDYSHAKHLGSEYVARHALIKPASDYFTQPNEEQAEAIKLFRLGPDTRSKLFKEAPQLYESAKMADQEEIDRVYGASSSKDSKLIRAFDGSLVTNNAENRTTIKQAEQF